MNAVAQAVLGSGCAFGVLPQGTFNYFGRTHGIPQDTALAMQLLLHAPVQPVQVGLVNDRVFLVNASVGLYPRLLEEREGWKRRFGRSRLVAFGAGATTLLRGYRSLRLQIEVQGQTRRLRTPTLFVGNNPLQLEQLGFPQAQDGGARHARRHRAAAGEPPDHAVADVARRLRPARRRRPGAEHHLHSV